MCIITLGATKNLFAKNWFSDFIAYLFKFMGFANEKYMESYLWLLLSISWKYFFLEEINSASVSTLLFQYFKNEWYIYIIFSVASWSKLKNYMKHKMVTNLSIVLW